jgi:uncharacterized protein
MMTLLVALSEIERLHKKFAPNQTVYDLVYGHCQIVAEIAAWCAEHVPEGSVDGGVLRTSALLHDIGSYGFIGQDGKGLNSRLYPHHAILGAKILQDQGIDRRVVDTVETHLLLGLSKGEIVDRPWPLPERDYRPRTLEGELLCYADRFHSKKPVFNSYDTFLQGLKADLPTQADRFERWSKRFGVPDIQALAVKYRHPIR